MFIRFLGYFQLFGRLDQLWKFDAKKQAIGIELFSKHSTKNLWNSLKVLHCCFCWDLVKQKQTPKKQPNFQLQQPTNTPPHPSTAETHVEGGWVEIPIFPHGVRNRHFPVARDGWNRGVGVVVGISGLDPVELGVEKLEVERGVPTIHGGGIHGRLVYLHMIFTPKLHLDGLNVPAKMIGKIIPSVSWEQLIMGYAIVVG